MAQKNNRIVVPEAKAAMEQFKMEAAREVGVNLENGCNGEHTARQAGSICNQIRKKMSPVRTASFERTNRIVDGHKVTVRYIASVIL